MIRPTQDNSTIAFSCDDERSTHAGESGEAFARGALVALRPTYPDWLKDRLWRIDRLSELEPNWDSYGGRQIHRMSIAFATQVLSVLSRVDTVEAPSVTASPQGNVALCWDDGIRSLDIEMLPSGVVAFSYMSENDPRKDCEGTTRDINRLIALLTQL